MNDKIGRLSRSNVTSAVTTWEAPQYMIMHTSFCPAWRPDLCLYVGLRILSLGLVMLLLTAAQVDGRAAAVVNALSRS